MPSRNQYALGVDLGQSNDPTVGGIVEQLSPGRFGVVRLWKLPLGTSYTEVVDRIEAEHRRLFFVDGELVLDATGVGRAVRDQLRARDIYTCGVTICGGNAETKVQDLGGRGEDWNLSRSLLLGNLSALVFSRQLEIASDVDHLSDFLRELQDLQVKISATGQDRIQVDASAPHHADLTFAIALAVWRLGQKRPRIETGRLDLMTR